jgi:hypothetical protein
MVSLIKKFNFIDELQYAIESKLSLSKTKMETCFRDGEFIGVILNGQKYSYKYIINLLGYIPILDEKIQQHNTNSNEKFDDDNIINEKINDSLYNSLKNCLIQQNIPFEIISPGVLKAQNYYITLLYTRPKNEHNVIFCQEICNYENDLCIGYFRRYNNKNTSIENLALIRMCEKCKKNEIINWMDWRKNNNCQK